jgi:hypothetical protein
METPIRKMPRNEGSRLDCARRSELASRINFELGLIIEELELLAEKRDHLIPLVQAMLLRGENIEKIKRLIDDLYIK